MLDKQKDIDARRRRDARSHARADRAGGDGSRQARLRAEAADLVGRRSARSSRARRRARAWRRRWATRATRGTTRGPRSSMYGPARSATCARSTSGPTGRSATGRRAFRGRKRATPPPTGFRWNGPGIDGAPRQRAMAGNYPKPEGARVGSLPRRRAVRRVSPGLSPVQLARLGRLGLRRDRRHGRAPDGSLDVGARSRLSDDDRNAGDAVQRRLLPATRR